MLKLTPKKCKLNNRSKNCKFRNCSWTQTCTHYLQHKCHSVFYKLQLQLGPTLHLHPHITAPSTPHGRCPPHAQIGQIWGGGKICWPDWYVFSMQCWGQIRRSTQNRGRTMRGSGTMRDGGAGGQETMAWQEATQQLARVDKRQPWQRTRGPQQEVVVQREGEVCSRPDGQPQDS